MPHTPLALRRAPPVTQELLCPPDTQQASSLPEGLRLPSRPLGTSCMASPHSHGLKCPR
jgi:hypothetical protein